MDDQRCRLDEPQNGDSGEGAANSMPSLNEMIGGCLIVLARPSCPLSGNYTESFGYIYPKLAFLSFS